MGVSKYLNGKLKIWKGFTGKHLLLPLPIFASDSKQIFTGDPNCGLHLLVPSTQNMYNKEGRCSLETMRRSRGEKEEWNPMLILIPNRTGINLCHTSQNSRLRIIWKGSGSFWINRAVSDLLKTRFFELISDVCFLEWQENLAGTWQHLRKEEYCTMYIVHVLFTQLTVSGEAPAPPLPPCQCLP
jgi:hypothetical protein